MRKKSTTEYTRLYRYLLKNLIDPTAVAKLLRCSRQTMRVYTLQGPPSYLVACAIAYVLGCTPEDIYSKEESRKARRNAL